MRDFERLNDLIARLVTIRKSLGSRVFRDAVRRAILGIARAAMAEAERKSIAGRTRERGSIVHFPLARRFSSAPEDDEKAP